MCALPSLTARVDGLIGTNEGEREIVLARALERLPGGQGFVQVGVHVSEWVVELVPYVATGKPNNGCHQAVDKL